MPSFARKLLLPLALATAACCSPLGSRAEIVESASKLKAKYDYIVIGGGTSGLTVADRLTEDPKVSVLVIEYGPLDVQQPAVLVPGIPTPTEYQRNYESIPQPGLNNRTVPLYTAGVVGGATVINGMFFNRGSAEDYDSWAELGNPGWAWKDLLPYFKKSENFTPPPPELAAKYPISSDLGPHGTSGPIGSSFPPYQYPIIKNFFDAWKELGVLLNPQPNDGSAYGAFYSPLSLTYYNQSRSTASTGHYRPFIGTRSNYQLIPSHSVTKILIDKKSKQATGVTFVSVDDTATICTVKAGVEVILAAGAVRSPGLLQLSGVGPKKLLEGLGIKVIEDLPGVGYNFQDQPTVYSIQSYSNYPFPSPNYLNTNATFQEEELALYYEKRQGAYTLTYQSGTTVCFLPLQNTTSEYKKIISDARKVDLSKILPAGAGPDVLEGYKQQAEVLYKFYASPYTSVQETAFAGGDAVPISLLKPLSRGSILINSLDSLADPVIDFGTFAHSGDLDVAVAAIRKNREFFNTEALLETGLVEIIPAPSVTSDDAIKATLRDIATGTWQHPVGTCQMTKRKWGGVVDSKLRVYGIKGLRVVDASIMPLVPATHTQSTVFAVAEKAADLIKAGKK